MKSDRLSSFGLNKHKKTLPQIRRQPHVSRSEKLRSTDQFSLMAKAAFRRYYKLNVGALISLDGVRSYQTTSFPTFFFILTLPPNFPVLPRVLPLSFLTVPPPPMPFYLKLDKVVIAKHCNVRRPDIAPVVLDYTRP